MLKTVSISSNRKLGGCAATYRSGIQNMYATCPQSCSLMPTGKCGSSRIDEEYLEAVHEAVPAGGVSWTYSHFTDEESLRRMPLNSPDKTAINLSADSVNEAVSLITQGYLVVVAVPAAMDAKVDVVDTDFGEKVRFVRCPAEYNKKVTCRSCGGGKPLCARTERNYVIKFTAHGNSAKKVGSEEKGGCYGSGGPVAIQWRNTSEKTQDKTDAQVLTEWVRTLPYGTFLRHHIVGDLG